MNNQDPLLSFDARLWLVLQVVVWYLFTANLLHRVYVELKNGYNTVQMVGFSVGDQTWVVCNVVSSATKQPHEQLDW